MNTNPDTVAAMPHAVGVEKSVVSILLQYPEMIDEVPMLTQEHFYLPGTRGVFALLSELATGGKPIELVSFIQTLLDRGQLEKVGGPAALTEFYTYQPDPARLHHHAAILSEKLARRMTVAAAEKMRSTAIESEEAQEILDVTSAPISAIHDMLTGNRPVQNTKAVLRGCLDRWEALCTGQESPMGMLTSLTEINHRFRGLHGKQTIVISAYPGGGKTTLAGQFAIDAASENHNTLVCSLELPAETLMTRLLAYVARRPGDALTDPLRYCREQFDTSGPTIDMLKAVRSAAQKIATLPFVIEDLIGANVYQIAACIRRAHRKNPLKLVVVDFAQRIAAVPEMRRESREQRQAHASNYLADLTKELGFCLLMPSQLNKEGAAKHAEAINEDADLHLQIVQDRSGPNPTFKHQGIAVVKDRHHGQDGTLLPIILDGPMVRFIAKPFES
jgi:replicative DNA helicase